jgi:hypothetical protein
MSEKLKDVVGAEAKSVRMVAQEIVTSGAYLYPFKVSSRTHSQGFIHL